MRCNRFHVALAIAAVSVLALGGMVHAAVVIDSTYAAGASGGATGTYTFPSFDASSSDKLVVVVGSRRDRVSSHSINSVTYGGVSMIEAVEQRSGNSNEESTAIYYLDDPGAAGPIVVGLNANGWSPDSGISVLALSGTAPGVAATAGSIGASTSLNTLVNDTIVIAGSENLTNAGTPAPQAPLIDLAGSNLGSGYQFVPVAATVTPTFGSTGATTVAAAFEAAAGGPVPVVILETDFTGRIVSGKTAGNITWTTDGVADPGDLTFVPEGAPLNTNLFDTANAQGHFAPDMNVDNESPWSVTIPLTLTAAEVVLEDVVLDWQHFSNSGAFQGANRSVDWTVSLTGSSSGLLDSVTALNVSGTSGVETISFAAPLMLTGSETWSLKIHAVGNGSGNNTGLDAISVIGQVSDAVVPEPSTFVLAALGLLGLGWFGRRRRRLS